MNAIQYDAMHPTFDIVPEGEMIPEYTCGIQDTKDEAVVFWVRLKPNQFGLRG